MATAVSVAEVRTRIADVVAATDLITDTDDLVAELDNNMSVERIGDSVQVRRAGGLSAMLKHDGTVEFKETQWDMEDLLLVLALATAWKNSTLT